METSVHERGDSLLDEATMENSTFIFNSCLHKAHKLLQQPYITITNVEMGISVACLIMIVAVHGHFPSLRNLPGKNLMTLCGCLIITYIFMILDQSVQYLIPNKLCVAIGVIIQFTFLASFFWSNVMAYDIWKTIANLQPLVLGMRSNMYCYYSAYAWCATIIFATPAVVMQLDPYVAPEYRPRFGEERCWLSCTTSLLLYFIAPVAFVLLSNLIMIILTSRALSQMQSEAARLQINQHKKRFHVYIKLCFVVGLVWMGQLVPLTFQKIATFYGPAEVLTSLQGVFLFIIYICNKKVMRMLLCRIRRRFNCLKGSLEECDQIEDHRRVSYLDSPLSTASGHSRPQWDFCQQGVNPCCTYNSTGNGTP